MNRELTLIEKIRLEQANKKATLQQRKHQHERILRRRRRIAVIVLASIIVLFIYTIHHLFNSHNKSHALEVSKPVSHKEEKLERKEVKIQHVSAKTISTQEVSTKVIPTKQVENQAETNPSQPSIYNKNIPMPKEHQEYLYKLCKERGLDYIKTLALIKHESVFNPNEINETHDYGYFQVNLRNHQELAEKLHTANSPLNPYINMNWGTYVLSNLYQYWGERGYKGDTLDEVVWSSYNKGITGFIETGYALDYVYAMKEAVQEINQVI